MLNRLKYRLPNPIFGNEVPINNESGRLVSCTVSGENSRARLESLVVLSQFISPYYYLLIKDPRAVRL